MEKEKLKRWIWEWIETIVVALLLALIIRALLVQVFWIPSSSMEPTLNIQDRIVVNKFIYRFQKPQRFDVVVFRFPGKETKKDFIKRVIGLPGEKVEIRAGDVYINDEKLEENHKMNTDYSYFGPVEIPSDSYLCLGDNRPRSADSRVWGFVPRKNIYGPAFLKIWPLWQLGIVH